MCRENRIDVAVRRAVLTGVGQTTAEIGLSYANDMGCSLVETSAHVGARPEHAAWQGQIFSLKGESKYPNFKSSTGYGTGAGLCGWNCRHSFYPFFEGLSSSAYPRNKLEEYNNKTVVYNGEKMSYYDATQKQRYFERQIRRWKRENAAMDELGLGNSDAESKIKTWQAAQRTFITQTGLNRDYFRERSGLQNLEITQKGGIIRLSTKAENSLVNKSITEVSVLNGSLSNRAARVWYKAKDEAIPKIIDKSKSVEDQARQAHELRNKYRTAARDLMRDQAERFKLDIENPNKTFDELLADKIARKGLTPDEALADILNTASKTNSTVNKSFGLEM